MGRPGVPVTQLRLTLLGGFQARLARGDALLLPTRKAQALLAYLALPVGRSHPRDKLAALLWGGIRDESARASLRQALFVVRKAIEGADAPALRADGEALSLEPAAVDVDVVAFERAVREGSAESLERAAALYQGDLLAGLVLDEPPFEEWLIGERERLRELALEALAKLLAHQRRGGAAESAVATALRLLSLDPLQEAVHRALMRCYSELGRRGAALRQYQACVSALQRELGIEPDAETKALYQEILRERRPAAMLVERVAPSGAAPDARTGSRETTLIGRIGESATLNAALDAAASGRGGVAVVLGEAGIGKSRLVAELVGEAAGQGVTVLLGRAFESEQILPFAPWVDALRAGRIADDADALARLGAPVQSELARLMPELGGASAGGTTDVRPVFESVAQVITILAARRPLLIVLEDLHWADEMSARLLAFVGRRLTGRAALLMLTARDDELAEAPALRQALDDLERDGRLTTVALAPLSRAETVALVSVLAPRADDALRARLGEQAWVTSEGNPFVAVETVRAYADGATVTPREGAGLPARVREIVSRRLERLSERAQTLAAVAAVIGREFDFPLLQRAGGLGEEETAVAVEELVRRRVLQGGGEIGQRFDFTHDRIRDVTYARLLTPRRRMLHRRAAEAIEALHAAELDAHALALGRHYREAEVWEPAVTYLRKAGTAAFHRAANREAVQTLESALAASEHIADASTRIGLGIDLRVDIELALMAYGEFRRGLERLREAEQLATAADDRGRMARIYYRMTYDLASGGELDEALRTGARALRLAAEADDVRATLGIHVVISRALYARGDYREAIEVAARNDTVNATLGVNLGGVVGAHRNVSFSRVFIALATAEIGDFAAGIAAGTAALEAATRDGWPHEEVWACVGLGRLYVVQGAFERAITLLESRLPRCETSSDLAVYFSRVASSLGEAYVRSGRVPEGLRLLERAVEHADTLGFAFSQALVVAALGEARLLGGQIEEAGHLGARALDLARRYGQRGWQAWALRLLGEVETRRPGFDQATVEAHFAGAVALATERGMRPLLAHCRLGLSRAYRRGGDKDRARVELDAAHSEYRALGVPYWTAFAEASGQA